MIKGKFAATIEIDIAVDENTPGLLPFEKLKEAVHNEMEAAVNDMLCEEFGDIATVKVTKTFADLYRTERRCRLMDKYMMAACWIVCPMCDEPKCVGRFNCPEIIAWVEKRKEGADNG